MVSAMVVSAVTDQCDARSLLWFSPCCLPFPPACLWCAVFPRVAWQPAGMPFGVQVDGVGTELNCTASSGVRELLGGVRKKTHVGIGVRTRAGIGIHFFQIPFN